MTNLKRYMVRGKRVDNGDWVEGFLICGAQTATIVTATYETLGHPKTGQADSWIVDPDTVEPVAVAVKRTPDGTFCPCCGGCKIASGDFTPLAYCPECGQRLDWQEDK